MDGIAPASRQPDEAAHFQQNADGNHLDVGKILPYMLAENKLGAGASQPALPAIPMPSMVEYFKSYRPEGRVSSEMLDQIVSAGDPYLTPTAKYLRQHFDNVTCLGNEKDQGEITDNDLDILATLLGIDAKFNEAKTAAAQLKQNFRDIDTNGDGQLIRSEVRAYANKHSPAFDAAHVAAKSQWDLLAAVDSNKDGISWTDTINIANGDAEKLSLEDAYINHQVRARGWWVDYASAAVGAGVGYYITRESSVGAKAGTAAGLAFGAYVVGNDVTRMVLEPGVRKYYASKAAQSTHELFMNAK